MNQISINLANEWGPSTSVAWQNAYQYQAGSITALSASSITVNNVSVSNPFINSGFGYISGAGGITNQMVWLSAFGGSSGNWTANISKPISSQIGTGNSSQTVFAATLTTPVMPATIQVYDGNQNQSSSSNGQRFGDIIG